MEKKIQVDYLVSTFLIKKSAIKLGENPMSHAHTKHNETRLSLFKRGLIQDIQLQETCQEVTLGNSLGVFKECYQSVQIYCALCK